MIAVIDYGAGNLRSVVRALEKTMHPCKVTSDPKEVLRAEGVVLPGVGAAGDSMRSLRALGMVEPLGQIIAEGKPFLGICLGLQVLFASTEEGGGHDCLGLVPGVVRRLPAGLKVPHMGWNQVWRRVAHPIFERIPDGAYFYFVHSYYAQPEERRVVAAQTDYGIDFCSVIVRENVIATQFHPEKSGHLGLDMYRNFVRMVREGAWK